MSRYLVAFGMAAALTVDISAQSFDAASIKTSRESALGRGFVGLQPGRLVATEASTRELIGIAFGVQQNQILGGPPWTESTRYNITATTGGLISREQVQAMLQRMLTARFGLVVHREKRQLPSYVLKVARRGSLGKSLRRSGSECAPVTLPPADSNAPPPPPPPPPPPSGSAMTPIMERPPLRCPTMFFPGVVSARAFTMDEFAYRLTRFVSRPVVDNTGLTGEFDIDLVFQSDSAVLPAGDAGGVLVGGPGPGAPPGAGPAGPLGDSSRPALMRAVQEQLGLRLEAESASVAVIVIDRVARPTEN